MPLPGGTQVTGALVLQPGEAGRRQDVVVRLPAVSRGKHESDLIQGEAMALHASAAPFHESYQFLGGLTG